MGEAEFHQAHAELIDQIYTKRIVGHAEARAVAQRLINSHFRIADKECGRASIPANPDHDDDLLIISYIRQQERDEADLLAELAATAAENERLRQALSFYADLANWGGRSARIDGKDDIVTISCDDLIVSAPPGHRLGPALDLGHHARTILAELAEGDPSPSTKTSLTLGG